MTEAELDSLLAREPANIEALLLKGDLLRAGGDERSAVTFYQAALRADVRRAPAGLAEDLRRAEALVAQAGGHYRLHLERWLDKAGLAPEQVSERFAASLRILFGEQQAAMALQRPSVFYFDGLPQRAFYERGGNSPGLRRWSRRRRRSGPNCSPFSPTSGAFGPMWCASAIARTTIFTA